MSGEVSHATAVLEQLQRTSTIHNSNVLDILDRNFAQWDASLKDKKIDAEAVKKMVENVQNTLSEYRTSLQASESPSLQSTEELVRFPHSPTGSCSSDCRLVASYEK